MNDLSIVMPTIAAIGSIIICSVLLILRSKEKREKMSTVEQEQFTRAVEKFIQDNIANNVEIRKDLQTVKEKVESIEGMLKNI